MTGYNNGGDAMDILRVPVYPSQEVIFPGQLLALQYPSPILEPMVRACVAARRPLGIVWTSGAHGHHLARVGTLVRFLGRLQNADWDAPNILVAGQERFRVLQMHQDHTYMEATVHLWPWTEDPRPRWNDVEALGAYLQRYVTALSDVLPPAFLPEAVLPGTTALGVLGAALLQLPSEEKQRLLEIPTMRVLLREVLRYMRVYVPMAERLACMTPPVSEAYERISFN